jgi:hypothetical protein
MFANKILAVLRDHVTKKLDFQEFDQSLDADETDITLTQFKKLCRSYKLSNTTIADYRRLEVALSGELLYLQRTIKESLSLTYLSVSKIPDHALILRIITMQHPITTKMQQQRPLKLQRMAPFSNWLVGSPGELFAVIDQRSQSFAGSR